MADAKDYPAELRRIATNVLLDGEDRDMRILDEAAAELERLTPKAMTPQEVAETLSRHGFDGCKRWVYQGAKIWSTNPLVVRSFTAFEGGAIANRLEIREKEAARG